MGSEKPSRELELKLAGTARDMPAFKRAVAAVSDERQVWEVADLTTRYFDTPEHRLFKKGIALRVRRAKGKFLQTIKAERGGGGALDRAEWEQPVIGAEPELQKIPKAARRKIGRVPQDALHPLMALEVKRQKTIIRRPNSKGPDLEVEAVVDRGVVQAGEKRKPFAECELELLQGDPAAFYALAREIHEACPLRLSRTTKSDRGYALLDPKPAAAVKLPKFELCADHTISETLGEVFEACIGNIIDNEAAALEGKDREGVHQLRVSVRRLRSALTVFRDYIDPGLIAGLDTELKWLASSFGPAREWDVFETEILPAVSGYGIDPNTLSSLTRPARSHRRAGYDLVRATLRSERYAKLMMRLTAFAATEGWVPKAVGPENALFRPLGEDAPAILERPYRKLLKAGKGLKKQSPEQRHQVRIKLKKLRYAVDFLGGLYTGKDMSRFIRKLRRLQDEFGHLNDVAQTKQLVDSLTRRNPKVPDLSGRGRLAAGMVLGWYAQELKTAEKPLLKNWNAFRKAAPPWHNTD